MFPGVDGFHWTAFHVGFVAVFLSVALVIATTAVFAAFRARRALLNCQADRIRWHLDFIDLPSEDRRCRHEFTGEAPGRLCPNSFDCRKCEKHPTFAPPEEGNGFAFGLPFPAHRYYHRGHTWVEPKEDGTLLVGLDEIGKRVMGNPDRIEMPPVGTRLDAWSTAWRFSKKGVETRVLAPVDGEVIETGGPDKDWWLRIKPERAADLRHLLRGSEVRAWVGAELERMQDLFRNPEVGMTLADGGVLVDDLSQAFPDADWDLVLGEMFLEP